MRKLNVIVYLLICEVSKSKHVFIEQIFTYCLSGAVLSAVNTLVNKIVMEPHLIQLIFYHITKIIIEL